MCLEIIMSEITAKVEEILSVRPYDGQNGKVWYYKLAMDNGDLGEIGKKKENFFKVGDSLTYTIEEGQYGNKFKAVQTGNGFSGNGRPAFQKESQSEKSPGFALAYAKDLAVAYSDKIPSDKVAETTIKIADKFLDWLNSKKV